ncbi:MAG: type IV secretion system protein [Endozoicomonadaceae bacterium]|nr:type IV secretion system protein [Endozoicomonadaceae bacterium]
MSDKEFYRASMALPQNDITTVKKSTKQWKFISVSCLIIILFQFIFIGYLIKVQNEYVYVARVKAGEEIENVTPLRANIKANSVIKLAFIRQYIERLMSLSIDPVLVKQNWLNNYKLSGISARKALSNFINSEQLTDKIGKETRVINIRTFNAISDNSFQFTWDIISYNKSGEKNKTTAWSGVFTLATISASKKINLIELYDPFGLQVESFSLNKLGT